MSKKDAQIYYGCPNCIEPQTTFKHGEHVFIYVTATRYGAKCAVKINCSVCNYTEDVTEKVVQVSKISFDAL